MTHLRQLALSIALHLAEWATRGDRVAEWALRHPTLAYQWLDRGMFYEQSFPMAVDALLAQEMVVPVSRLDVN